MLKDIEFQGDHAARLVGISVSQPGPLALGSESSRVLNTGPPGNSQDIEI